MVDVDYARLQKLAEKWSGNRCHQRLRKRMIEDQAQWSLTSAAIADLLLDDLDAFASAVPALLGRIDELEAALGTWGVRDANTS
jgi:hypothetical protein